MSTEEVRANLVAALEADLVGPFFPPGSGVMDAERERLPLPPSRWYLTGFLAPKEGRELDPDDVDGQDELASGDDRQDEEGNQNEPDPKRRQRFPASMGLSVILPPGPMDGSEQLEVEVRWAHYDKLPEEAANDGGRETPKSKQQSKQQSKQPQVWQRVPSGPYRVPVKLCPKTLQAGITWPQSAQMQIRGELGETGASAQAGVPAGSRMLSLFLVNDKPALEQDRDLNFVFQVELALHYPPGFVARRNRTGEDSQDGDPQVLALQFRHSCEWAVGHNTSVQEPTVDPDGKVRSLRTTQLPHHEVRRVRANKVPALEVGMEALSQLAAPAALKAALLPLISEYGAWITAQRDKSDVPEKLQDTRSILVAEAETARKRMQAGIDLLVQDDMARLAFCLANRAMHNAAMEADKARSHRRYADGALPSWRPFQLAFVLLNLVSIVDPTHIDRKTAELIYFPTGGGKTEAYLGLIAFTLVLRRLRSQGTDHGGRGVAILLRYTLRLLTLDQLGRAATLMCALEQLRQQYPQQLGSTRFAVGLWVGRAASANRLKEVQTALSDFTPGQENSPFPLSYCPWCSHDLHIGCIKLLDAAGKPSKTKAIRAAVYCPNIDCAYSERNSGGAGLPVLFVDDQIYAELPDFVVATVDKFAMMPWRGEAGMLFGRVTHIDDHRAYGVMDDPPKTAKRLSHGLLPPELIVQDELHLISGPLGTMVGLYESAIDYLCQQEINGQRHVPKIVCSTATARRAQVQIRALFNRNMRIFPPRGVDDGDNFFAVVDKETHGRLYLGVCAPGRALRAVSVRTYATLLAAAQKHYDPNGAEDQDADPYMTLVGYFNSLRELGGMRRLVEDEVATRVKTFDGDGDDEGKRPHGYDGPHPWAAGRKLIMPAELTSREKTEAVKSTKQRLATPRATERDGGKPLDTVLASNMIAVGLDVDRLGLMVVTGQPKTSSEYIQATSRVGRQHPGLVVTCLNSARPRDRSHYERFVAYHQSFYRHVEATSVTPFSLQTLERGMVGTLLSMIRHGLMDMEPARGIMRIENHRDHCNEALETLVERCRAHRASQDTDAEARLCGDVRARGQNFLDSWQQVVDRARAGAADRTYSGLDRGAAGKPLLRTATDEKPEDPDERRFEAPTSMRDVEPSTHIWLRFKPLDER